ncbi:MAG: aminotransferase class V-fold PLP-dependent enzyme, partial [Jiangellaceae bacterium]
SINRRAFIGGGAAAVAAAGVATLTGCTGDDAGQAGAPSAPPTDLSSWDNIRAQFAVDPGLAHFAAFVLATHPAPVRAAIDRWRAELDADVEKALADGRDHDEATRSAAGRYLGVGSHEIALTDSTTMGLGLVYHGLDLQPGDHVLTTTHDFYSTHESLRLVAERSGAEVEKIELYDPPASASVDAMVARLEGALRRPTRVVALTWVHSSTGVKLPVREIADLLAAHNAERDPAQRILFCLDAVHGMGAEDTGPVELGCDVFISGTHKWLFGPRGTGIIWASTDAGSAIAPIIPPFDAPNIGNWLFDRDEPSPFALGNTPGGYQAFEHRWAMADAFEFHLSMGRDRVAARTRELATRLKDGLAELLGVHLVTPRDPALSSGLVCVDVDGRDPFDVVTALRDEHKVVASVTPYRTPYV